MRTILTISLGILALTSCLSQAEESYGKETGLLGPVTVGPKISVGAPAPFRVGVEAKFLNIAGISFDYGFLPAISYQDVSMSTDGWNITGRFFIFQRALFIGLGFGNQSFSGSQTDTVAATQVTATATIKQTFLAPHIGWRWTWSDGLYFGMELGAQIPLSTSATTTTDNAALNNDPTVVAMLNRSSAQAEKFGNNPLPWLGLLQVGYYF